MWDIHWIWNPRHWAIHKITRFNSGRPYESYRFGPLFIRRFLKKKIHNECTFLRPDGIAKVENMYNAKYVFESCLKMKDGGWCNMPVAIFYTEKAHPEGSNYFGLYRTDFGDLMITNGISATEPFDALQVGEDIIYSRYRHDYREYNGAMVDGGRDYFKTNRKGTPVKLQVVGDHLEIVE